jgi:DNA-binding transcriptional regulator YiaG
MARKGKDTTITCTAFAKQLGVSKMAVSKAIKSGAIINGVVYDDKKKPCIIPDIALVEWAQNYNPNRPSNPNLKEALLGVRETLPPEDTAAAKDKKEDESLAVIKRLREGVKLRREKLAYEKELGTMVNKAEQNRKLFDFGQQVRTSLEAIPDRIVDNVMAAKNRNECYNILRDSIHEALLKLTEYEQRNG